MKNGARSFAGKSFENISELKCEQNNPHKKLQPVWPYIFPRRFINTEKKITIREQFYVVFCIVHV